VLRRRAGAFAGFRIAFDLRGDFGIKPTLPGLLGEGSSLRRATCLRSLCELLRALSPPKRGARRQKRRSDPVRRGLLDCGATLVAWQ
jgi:hypothetical protein